MKDSKIIQHDGVNRIIQNKGIDGIEVDTYKKCGSKKKALDKLRK